MYKMEVYQELFSAKVSLQSEFRIEKFTRKGA